IRRPACGHTFSHACTEFPLRASSNGSPSGSGGSTPSTPPSGMSSRRHRNSFGVVMSIRDSRHLYPRPHGRIVGTLSSGGCCPALSRHADQAIQCSIGDGSSLARTDRGLFNTDQVHSATQVPPMRARFIHPTLPRHPLLRMLVVAGLAILLAALLARAGAGCAHTRGGGAGAGNAPLAVAA